MTAHFVRPELIYTPHHHLKQDDDSAGSSDGDGCYSSSSEDEFGMHGMTHGIVRIQCVPSPGMIDFM